MASDLYIEQDGEKFFLGIVTKVNDDGTVEVQMDLERITKLFELRPDLLQSFLKNIAQDKE